MGNKIIVAVRLVTRRFPFLYGILGKFHHAIQYQIDHFLLRKMYPDVKHIKINESEISNNHKDGFQSQYGQEKFLLNSGYIPSEGGRFIDIGCNHPVECSNTYALEKMFGYTGLAIDPLTSFIEFWGAERPNSLFVNKFLSSRKKKIEFVEVSGREGWEHMLSGANSSVRTEGKDVEREVRNIETLPLQDVLDESGYESDVDVMFVDVEGHEAEVIDGVDWSRTAPRVIVIENFGKFNDCNVLRSKLINLGYKFIARIGISDDIFLHENSIK